MAAGGGAWWCVLCAFCWRDLLIGPNLLEPFTLSLSKRRARFRQACPEPVEGLNPNGYFSFKEAVSVCGLSDAAQPAHAPTHSSAARVDNNASTVKATTAPPLAAATLATVDQPRA